MKIAIFSSSLDGRAGWGNITLEYCSELLLRDDIEFELHIPKTTVIPHDIQFTNNIILDLPEWIGTFRKAWFKAAPYVFSDVQLDSINLIHVVVEFPYAILARSLSRQFDIPYVVSMQGTYAVSPFERIEDRSLYKQAMKEAALITAASDFTANAFLNASGINRDVRIVPNAVNFKRFQKDNSVSKVREELGLNKDDNLILGVGGLKERKGFDVLIQAFALVKEEISNSMLVIAGDGPLRKNLGELVENLALQTSVKFIGNVYGDKLVSLYQSCDLFSLSPRKTNSHFEGFGIVYLEASSCGKPIVATRSGGVADAVLDGQTGILVDEDDVNGVAKAIKELLENKSLARKLGEQGRKFAISNTWDEYINKMFLLFNEIITF